MYCFMAIFLQVKQNRHSSSFLFKWIVYFCFFFFFFLRLLFFRGGFYYVSFYSLIDNNSYELVPTFIYYFSFFMDAYSLYLYSKLIKRNALICYTLSRN